MSAAKQNECALPVCGQCGTGEGRRAEVKSFAGLLFVLIMAPAFGDTVL